MPKPVNVAILTFPRCQVLDVTGPAMVFEAGNDALGKVHYRVHILSVEGGAVQTSSAVALLTKALRDVPAKSIDTLLVVGGDEDGLRALGDHEGARKWVLRAAGGARRYGSICTGTFALAQFGLLDGKRVATHWSACGDLAKRWPSVAVDTSALFVNDGRLWTSLTNRA
ncbi:MAG: AraC family transcriptional regulator, partial [Comamonadaceae bacterium]